MQQVANYGCFLQAYALKTIIQGLGHNVRFIDIIPGEQLPQYRQKSYTLIRKGLRRILCKHPISMAYYSLAFHKMFDSRYLPFLNRDNARLPLHCDVVVIGSDEVFNVAQHTWFGFSPQLFGDGIDADKIISYAACCGATTTDKLKEAGIYDAVKEKLNNNFAAISVRDKNSVEMMTELTGKQPEMHIDPVFLYDFEREIAESTPHSGSKYMVIYTYPNRIKDKSEIQAITQYAKSHDLKIISIGNYFPWVDSVEIPDPFEVLAYFRDATCVVTDTFQGTVMSMKYNTPFVTFIRDMNRNKLSSLLDQFNLNDRISSDPAQISQILDTPLDFTDVSLMIELEREKSLKYLESNLK